MGLDRFLVAQAPVFREALAELRAGRKHRDRPAAAVLRLLQQAGDGAPGGVAP